LPKSIAPIFGPVGLQGDDGFLVMRIKDFIYILPASSSSNRENAGRNHIKRRKGSDL
jgi:hypothetical protein